MNATPTPANQGAPPKPESEATLAAPSGSARFGVWITDMDGTNGRWMTDRDNGLDVWAGSESYAQSAAACRRHLYSHFCYTVREVPKKALPT